MRSFHPGLLHRRAPVAAAAAFILVATPLSARGAQSSDPSANLNRSSDAYRLVARHSEPIDVVLWFMRRIYELLGGDPSELEILPPDDVLSAVAGYFHQYGFPPGLSQNDKDVALYDISQLQGYLGSTPLPTGISSGAAAAFLVVLQEMHEALLPTS